VAAGRLNSPVAAVQSVAVPATWARAWFAATTIAVVAGVVISVLTAAHNSGGHFRNGVERGFNAFAFFTIQSNLVVGATSLLLAIDPLRRGRVFSIARQTGLVAITVTGIVFHVALGRLLDLESWDLLGNHLVHSVVPVMALVGWLLLGPRDRTSASVARWSLVFPVFWLAFTLVRGAVIHWYPYPFVDVSSLGYGKVVLNCVWVALLFLGLSGGVTVLDGYLKRARPDVPRAARETT
jgi:hypothetical protein